MSNTYNQVSSDQVIAKTAKALEANGFTVMVVESSAAAKQAVLELIPSGAEVFTVTSKTTDQTGISQVLNESGKYSSVRQKFMTLMSDPSKKSEMRKIASAPDYVVGSVHAVTQDGKAIVVSATGSQLPAYTYGAGQVIWVVGGQKITKDEADAMKRITTHVFPLEDERAQEAYGIHSSINKVVTFHKELPGRITIILVKEALGF